MSECKWCDVCDTPYPDSDLDARAIQEHVPEIVNGVKRGHVAIERHQCGNCTRKQNAQREARRAAIAATLEEEPE